MLKLFSTIVKIQTTGTCFQISPSLKMGANPGSWFIAGDFDIGDLFDTYHT